MRKVVVNSTQLISLASIGRLDLLSTLYDKIYIPNSVLKKYTLKENPRSVQILFSIWILLK